MTAFLARLGDRINPIVVKETRQAVNSRLVAAFLLLFLAVQLVVVLLMITKGELGDPDEINLRAGRELFTFVQGILLGTCMVLIPTLTGTRLAVERSDVNVDLLFISSLTPRAVLFGKFVAAAALALLIFSACAPFMTFAYVMRGLDIPTIFVVLAADYLAVLVGTALSLFVASVPSNRMLRVFLGVFAFAVMCYMCAGLLALSSDFLRGGSDFDMSSWKFWAAFGSFAALIFGVIGLLFVWSVAMISPPAANRTYGVRVYTLIFWLGTAALFGVWSLYLHDREILEVWGAISCALFSLQMIVASCERDHWGPRVARRIPRRLVFRTPAFFFYTGSAGGLCYGVIGAALSAVMVGIWSHSLPGGRRGGDESMLIIVSLIPAYTYCYCMTAILVRRMLSRAAFRSGFTWVIGALLFGLGCTLPYIVRFAFMDRSSRYGYQDDVMALYLTNPVVMIDDAIRGYSTNLGLTVGFLVVWGGAVTLFNLTWLLKQMANFRPLEAEDEAE